jgi:O-antigen ligase
MVSALILILSFFAIFLSLGKAAILSLLLGMLYLFLRLKDKRIGLSLIFSFLILAGVVLFSSFFSGLIERAQNVFSDFNTQFRIMEYEVGWKIFNQSPWLGSGAGQQLSLYSKWLFPGYSQWANNYLLQAAIDLGLAGLAAFAFIIYSVYGKIKEKYSQISEEKRYLYYGIAASFIVVLINGLFEVTVFALPYAIALWSLVGVMKNIEKYG